MSRNLKIRHCIDNGSKLANRDLIAIIDDIEKRQHLGLTTEPFEFVVEVEQFIAATLDRLEQISRKIWVLPEDFECHFVLNYRDTKAGRSNAAVRPAKWRSNYELKNKTDGNCINLNSLWGRMHGEVFPEYAHIKADPQIGAVRVDNWKEYIELLLCHEFAHILEKYVVCDDDFPNYKPKKCHGHGYNWQCIYRWLRIRTGHVTTKSANPKTIEKTVLSKSPKCQFCGNPFTSKRSDTKFCSPKCKVYFNRKKSI